MTYTLTYTLINNNKEYAVTDYTGEPINVVIPNEYNGKPVTLIEEDAFYYCDSLTSIVIGDNVKVIGDNAFEECTSLTRVVFGKSVTTVRDYAFYYCTSLTKLDLGDSLVTIGNSAFAYCNLRDVVIPNSVTTIGHDAFYWGNLRNVIIPASVTAIGNFAFAECNTLNNVMVLGATPPSVSSNSFPSSASIYCYAHMLDTYKNAAGWIDYPTIKADDMRLYFGMNANAQKRYLKNELGDFHFENNYIHWDGDPYYDGIKIGMDEMNLIMKADSFRFQDNENLGDWVLSYDGPNCEFHVNTTCNVHGGIYTDYGAYIKGDLTLGSGYLYASTSELYLSAGGEDSWLLFSEDEQLIQLRIASAEGVIRLETEGSTQDSGIVLHSVSSSATSQISLDPAGAYLRGQDNIRIVSTSSPNGIISSAYGGAEMALFSGGKIAFNTVGASTFTWNGNPILTKANFTLSGTTLTITV